MIKAYFNNIESKIIPYIKNAKENIFCAIAWFTNPHLLNVLNERAKDIDVYLVIINDGINNKLGGLNFQEFIDKGGKLYFGNEQNLMHHKFCIIDKKIVINGSYNWTILAEKSNRENVTITDKKKIVKLFFHEFEDVIGDLERVKKVKEVANYDIKEMLIKSFILQEEKVINNPTLINKVKGTPGKVDFKISNVQLNKKTPQKKTNPKQKKSNVFKISGKPFRVKLRWYTKDDLDLHMLLPNRKEIYYENMTVSYNGAIGKLDTDANVNELSQNPVENIKWDNLPKGKYEIFVEHYKKNEKGKVPFEVTIYADGERKVIKKSVKEEKKKTVLKFKVK